MTCSVRYTCNGLFSHFITNKLLFYFNVVYCDDLNLDLLYNHRLNNLWLQRGTRNQLLTSHQLLTSSRYPQFSLLLNDRHVNFCPGRILSVPELSLEDAPKLSANTLTCQALRDRLLSASSERFNNKVNLGIRAYQLTH